VEGRSCRALERLRDMQDCAGRVSRSGALIESNGEIAVAPTGCCARRRKSAVEHHCSPLCCTPWGSWVVVVLCETGLSGGSK
jgi:hypothetical protein